MKKVIKALYCGKCGHPNFNVIETIHGRRFERLLVCAKCGVRYDPGFCNANGLKDCNQGVKQ